MAEVMIEVTEDKGPVTAGAKFNFVGVDLKALTANMGVVFNGETRAGSDSLIEIYNTFDAAGKAIVLEFMKKMVVGCFNDAMGTDFTWDQVKDSIFG